MPMVDSTAQVFFEQGGTLVHVPSGMQFPRCVCGFEREERPTVYGSALGLNVSVGYRRRSGFFGSKTTTLTLYVYPGAVIADAPEAALEAEFQRAKADITTIYPDAAIELESYATLPDGECTVAGRRALFRIPGRDGKTLSELQLFRRGVWVLKSRVTIRQSRWTKRDRGATDVLEMLGIPRGT